MLPPDQMRELYTIAKNAGAKNVTWVDFAHAHHMGMPCFSFHEGYVLRLVQASADEGRTGLLLAKANKPHEGKMAPAVPGQRCQANTFGITW